jgi:peptidoglycan hydrolase-like protein with peptidoglycan-binding domain
MQPLRHVRQFQNPVCRGITVIVIGLAAAMLAGADRANADSSTTVVYDEAGDAPDIGLIGDSSLSGVRWYDDYGDLRKYNFVFDAESCRRTLETSCWSREQYRAETALRTMQRLSGEWGEVLVMMSGYNDPGYGFDDAVDAVIAEAKRQGIPRVMWLTLPTSEVSYEEPLHLANAETYRESNQFLLDTAAEHGGYLQVADWAGHSTGESSWFEYDGVHLTAEGVDGVTTFIADQVGRVLAGENVTPPAPPWVTLSEGDNGGRVARVQQALIDDGLTAVGGVDGAFGTQTAAGVRTFQRQRGLAVSGVVDRTTAIALGVYTPTTDAVSEAVTTGRAPATTTDASPSTTEASPPTTEATIPAKASTTTIERQTSPSPIGGIVIAPILAGGSALLALGIRRRARSHASRNRTHR